MVNKKDIKTTQDEIEITNTAEEPIMEDSDVVETDERFEDKIKTLKAKLKESEEKQREFHEELQRTKADFLNAKRRLEEERHRDKERAVEQMIERLLPLCDSFYMAMSDKVAWEKADPVWRKGIEGIHAQLINILGQYQVSEINPVGEIFDPSQHEALSTEKTTASEKHNEITAIIQLGYQRNVNDVQNIIRPARVIVAEYSE